MAFTLPDLPYDYAALEPYIDATTMQIHHECAPPDSHGFAASARARKNASGVTIPMRDTRITYHMLHRCPVDSAKIA